MKKFLSLILSMAVVLAGLPAITGTAFAEGGSSAVKYNFTSQAVTGATNVVFESGSAPLYSAGKGYGFVSKTSAMPSRAVAPERIEAKDEGFVITETAPLSNKDKNNYNYGGLVFRVDVAEPGAYALKVTTTSSKAETWIAPSGQQASRITNANAWDSAGLVRVQNPAVWTDDHTWNYSYVTGRNYIEFEIEPSKEPAAASPVTVGIAAIEITKLAAKEADGKPTVFVLGDSTQKTYTFEEAGMSGWGQIIGSMFDSSKVNVVNYSMGGRSLKSNYDEGRFNDILMTGKAGDYVLLHSAHNDESTGDSAGPEARFGRGSNNTTYPKWLNEIYIPALKSRGIIPVLVTSMPRTNDGKYIENTEKPNGFNPDSPKFMRAAAAADAGVELVELYENAKAYINKIGPEETKYIYMGIEAGETPGKTNSGSYANGHPDNKIDGTHYKEAAAKQWCKIIADQICKQVKAGTSTAQMTSLKSYLKAEVQVASDSGDWSAVFPEMAKDVSETGSSNAYYRNQIEKLLQLGVLFLDDQGKFYPKNEMKTNEFISALCALWNLKLDDFTSYYQSGSLTREVMAGIVYDAYLLKFGQNPDGSWVKPDYMTKYNVIKNNGTVISPDDPNYDPNLTGDAAKYYPLVEWGDLTDLKSISLEYAPKFNEVYQLGLMRSESGIQRGKMVNGTVLEPKKTVTREKAAKELWFLWALSQTNVKVENQVLTIPGENGSVPISYQSVDYTAPQYEFSSVDINADTNKLSVSLKYNGTGTPANQLVAELYDTDGTTKLSTNTYAVTGTGLVAGMDLQMQKDQKAVLYVTESGTASAKLSADREVVCGELIIPLKNYTVTTEAGIRDGTLALTNLSTEPAALALNATAEVLGASDDTQWWTASANITPSSTLSLPGLSVTESATTGMSHTMTYTAGGATVNGIKFQGRVASTENGKLQSGRTTGSGFKFTASENGIWSVYVFNLGDIKTFAIFEEGAEKQTDALASTTGSIARNQGLSVSVEKGKTYYATVLGSKGSFLGASFTPGAPVVTAKAKPGERVQITATAAAGYHVDTVSAVDSKNQPLDIEFNADRSRGIFTMPESNVTVSASFAEGEPEEETAVAVLTPTQSGAAVLIKAQYDQKGILLSSEQEDVTVTAGEPLVVEAPEGTKVMLWKSLNSTQPVAAAAISSKKGKRLEPTE